MKDDETAIDRLLGVRKKPAAKGKDGKAAYEAFDAKDRSKYLQIRTAQGVHRAPSYSYLLDVISDGDKGAEIALLFSFMEVRITGRNLQTIAHALIKRECAFIQEFDSSQFNPPSPTEPFIETLEIAARD
ncbi:hypothetical protein [Methylomagnum sp.]